MNFKWDKMRLYFLLSLTSATNYNQITYSKCDQVIGYWSPWGSWSSECKCKDNYEVTRFGRRYVKERRRQCFCGEDGVFLDVIRGVVNRMLSLMRPTVTRVSLSTGPSGQRV